MLDIKFIRENPDLAKENLKKRGGESGVIEKILEKDLRKREILKETENLRHSQKKLGRENIKEARELKEKIKEGEIALAKLEKDLEELLNEVPNIVFDDVPMGKNENDNVVLKEVGRKPEFDFEPKDYLEIEENLDLIDVSKAAETAGSRFGYLKRDAVLWEFALIKLAFKSSLASKPANKS